MQNYVFQTVIAGTLLFIASQFIKEFVLSPIKEFKKEIGKIDSRLKFYSNILTSSAFKNSWLEKEEKEILESIRKLSCELESKYKQILFANCFKKIIPSKKHISEAGKILIKLYNIGGTPGEESSNANDIKRIREILNIREL